MKRKMKLSDSLFKLLKPNFKESKSYRNHFEASASNFDALSREEFAQKFFRKSFQHELKVAV